MHFIKQKQVDRALKTRVQILIKQRKKVTSTDSRSAAVRSDNTLVKISPGTGYMRKTRNFTHHSLHMNLSSLARSFSTGDFEPVFPCLSDTVEWNLVGGESFKGKDAVIENCRQVARYFKTVQTRFTVHSVIAEGTSVAITGTALFVREGKKMSFFHACDVYHFNEAGVLEQIRSYCIEDKKEADRLMAGEGRE